MRLLHLLILILAMAAWPTTADAGTRVALVVGVSSYRAIPSLQNPSRDAAAVAAALRATGFEVTELNQPEQLTRAALGTALVRFRARADTAEAAIVYFAGHGVEVNGANWLLPSDVTADSPDDLEVTAIPASTAVNAVRGASTIRLVILDACRDNPFATNPGWARGNRSFGSRGLGREMGRADNVVLLLATQPGTKASDGSGTDNSPFARALATTLTTEGMQIAALPGMVSRRMRELTGIEQRPDQQGIFDEPAWMFRAVGQTLAGSTSTAVPTYSGNFVARPQVPPTLASPILINRGPYIVFFDWADAKVTSEATYILDRAVAEMAKAQGLYMCVAGYDDASGSTAQAMRLSTSRAANTRNYLITKGVAGNAITTKGFGSTNMRVPTNQGVRELQNRRVEITIGLSC